MTNGFSNNTFDKFSMPMSSIPPPGFPSGNGNNKKTELIN
jgi:hypothetical protein